MIHPLASSPAALVAVVIRASGLEPPPEPSFAERKDAANKKRRLKRHGIKATAELREREAQERWASIPVPVLPTPGETRA